MNQSTVVLIMRYTLLIALILPFLYGCQSTSPHLMDTSNLSASTEQLASTHYSESSAVLITQLKHRRGELYQHQQFVTEDDAHIAAASLYLPLSLANQREFSWRVYALNNSLFGFTLPNIGDYRSYKVALPPKRVKAKFVSAGHTHHGKQHLYSPQDWRVITQNRKTNKGVTLYLANALGQLQKCTPKQAWRKLSMQRSMVKLPRGPFSGTRISNEIPTKQSPLPYYTALLAQTIQ